MRAHAASRPSMVGAQNVSSAPAARTAATLTAGAPSGTTMRAGVPPRAAAAAASAAAWLPLLCVVTPRAASRADRENTALHAPRYLNEPDTCSASALKYRRASVGVRASSRGERSTGVRRTWGAMRRAAARTEDSDAQYSAGCCCCWW